VLLAQLFPKHLVLHLHMGAARYVLDTSNNDGKVARLRNEMMDCVALLGGR